MLWLANKILLEEDILKLIFHISEVKKLEQGKIKQIIQFYNLK